MFSILTRQPGPQLIRHCRFLTLGVSQSSSTSSPLPLLPSLPKDPKERAYYVPRNSRGNLPVYSDIRNAGGRSLVLIRNVEGNISMLARELSQSLFPKGSHEAYKLKIQVKFGKHLVISGGRWKDDVADWLKTRGF